MAVCVVGSIHLGAYAAEPITQRRRVAVTIQLPSGRVVNQSPLTNWSCFTPMTSTTASWRSVVFRDAPVTRTMAPTGNGVTESLDATSENDEDTLKWFSNLMSDTFT